jgi:hypothetical protein
MEIKYIWLAFAGIMLLAALGILLVNWTCKRFGEQENDNENAN